MGPLKATPIIEVAGLSCNIGGKVILKDLSFTVNAGEYVSIVGPNGSGKTTLLKCLLGIAKSRNGAIRMAGKRLNRYTRRELAGLVSYTPQKVANMPRFTVREFVMMGRYPHLDHFSGVRKNDEEAVAVALALAGSSGLADRSCTTLSGGERQKVLIAATLAQETPVMLLDEPTAFLDPRHDAEIGQLLGRINREQGITVVTVTHDLNSAAMTGGRIIALKEGTLVFCGDCRDFMDNSVLHKLYEKEFLIVDHPTDGRRVILPETIL